MTFNIISIIQQFFVIPYMSTFTNWTSSRLKMCNSTHRVPKFVREITTVKPRYNTPTVKLQSSDQLESGRIAIVRN